MKEKKECVKKSLPIVFSHFLIFFKKIYRDMAYLIRKQHLKFESIIIITEEILVLMGET